MIFRVITRGIYKTSSEEFSVVFRNEPTEFELFMGKGGQIVSAYKKTSDFEGCYLSDKAKTLFGIVRLGINGCTSKNGYAVPFDLGASSKHTFNKTNISFTVEKFNNTCCSIEIIGSDFMLSLDYCRERIAFPDIPYVKLTKASTGIVEGNEEDIPVRTLEEIALGDKDISWLKKKKYYIVNDEAEAEKIFTYLENYNGVISFDTETTGLRINMFGEIGSQKKRELEEYNANLIKEGEEPLRIDKLVGFIYCVERDVSYYFPCFNRKFKNLYENTEDEQTKKITDSIKARYTIGEYRDRTDNMANYIRTTPVNEWGTDVILMERNRKILESKQLLAHNGTYEWKVCWLYHIDFNLTEDTMIMHQLMFKFRDMTKGNRGEPSNLKHLTKVELGCDQLDLKDYFAGFEEDQGGEVRSGGKKKKKKSKLNIDFSYMDYEGTRAYAPADGDFTFQIFLKYKKWMLDNMPELEYIYKVEIIVSCAIAQMEYYGHRIDEEKIENIKQQSINEKIELEHKIRKLAGYSNEAEDKLFELVEDMNKKIDSLDIKISSIKQGIKDGNIDTVDGNKQLEEEKAKRTSFYSQKKTLLEQGTQVMASSEKELNLASPAQVTELFFTQLKYPFSGEKPSVAKKQIKSLVSALDENKQPKYPVAKYYSEWKKVDTLLTKFFDNLPYFMYPGGYIFSSFGQISTATGRMSCNKPNAQQYPKAVTGIVIPRPGHVMMDADFSQIEYRTLVAMANEEQLKSDFFDPDMDYHTKMASLMYSVDYAAVTGKMRSDAKSFNFGIPYGMGFGSLAILLTGVNNDATRAEAKEKYELYFKDQPKVRQFFEDVKESALVNRYTETRWHRRRYYSFEEKDGTFSNKKKAMSLRQAGNAVIQGSAADIFKISVARNFSWIRRNGLIGKVLIVNMIHDEQLMEIDCSQVNVRRAIADIILNMEMKVDGFPPLYVGAGVAMDWKDAKGEMAEIHPVLANQLISEAANLNLDVDEPQKPEDVANYFGNRVLQFRINKVADYVKDQSNYNKPLHPVIGKLLALQFDYGVKKEFEDKYNEDNGYTKEQIEKHMSEVPLEELRRFIEDKQLDVDYRLFQSNDLGDIRDEKEDDYDDDDEADLDGTFEDGFGSEFALIDSSNEYFGVDLRDIIDQFGLIVSQEKEVCGIDITKLPLKMKDSLFDYLEQHGCDPDDEGAVEVVFLMSNRVLKHTDIWVNNITGSEVAARLKLNSILYR